MYSFSSNVRRLFLNVLSLIPALFHSVSLAGKHSAVSLSAYIHNAVYNDLSDAFNVSSSITFRVTITNGTERRSITVLLFSFMTSDLLTIYRPIKEESGTQIKKIIYYEYFNICK